MQCTRVELLSILPQWMRGELDLLHWEEIQELRLRLHAPPEIVCGSGSRWLGRYVTAEDISGCINAASRYSPWSAATAAQGYLTAPGGHRIGICGEAVCRDGVVTGIRNPSSLCIRVARDFSGIAGNIPLGKSIIILGAPGWGKTTLLRDLIRQVSDARSHVSVVDERGELFPPGFASGKKTDILTGCPKAQGIPMLLRTMGPQVIAVDEITEEGDTHAILQAAGCGVQLLATAHAASIDDFRRRLVYRPLLEHKVFQTFVVMHRDKSWHLERME